MAVTSLSEVYDAFLIKSGKDYTEKESQVFQFLKTGISKSYKTVPEDLEYTTFTNNVVFSILDVPKIDGSIEIGLNGTNYVVEVLVTDTVLEILNKIALLLENEWDVKVAKSTATITKNGISTIIGNFVDTDNTAITLLIGTNYDGEFKNVVKQDSIELIALNMYLEEKRKEFSSIERIKQHMGTKDFNKLPDNLSQYNVLVKGLADLRNEIYEFRQEFYVYKG